MEGMLHNRPVENLTGIRSYFGKPMKLRGSLMKEQSSINCTG